ncbi:DegT/DnrJ/EryC1/StrS aminotransferase family protein [Rossellomorea sp. KS-H15a]|uniref:DegT/DnrJ/EryC1/StrS family aminotransferase n=1 Tax=Rossellomorea sp. KS-H15a TaxID=2963940 RepID=UPI0020C6494F|nr:DegT/DnrJ/EryC1/StrS family aminotransferase [Rossellomorea sp. KS-H15a]UTE77430.1 DegT/DnrJ/EryC1/StrS family aminotransferase [Rossellomorea sp. KS-H15a]
MDKNRLAIKGGPKVKDAPFCTGKRFGVEEAKELLEALEQNTLFYHFGQKVKQFLSDFNDLYNTKYSVATSSGTAAIHVALGAAGVTAGDEVITSPITDQGTVIGILYQNAIPIFADLDPHSYNLTAESIEQKITNRTKAILVVHLAGNPCDMDSIMKVAEKYQLKVIEDCAQSYLAEYKGQLTGTIGDYGCFSTNDFKHISTGDGGIVTINSEDEGDYFTAHAFADKNYQRLGDSVSKDIEFLAPNYRMTELQGAVGIAQLKKLRWICSRRNELGERLHRALHGIRGIIPMDIHEDSWCSYWFYMFTLSLGDLCCSRQEFSDALAAEGIPNQAGYIPKVLYAQPLFQHKQAYRNSQYPFDQGSYDYMQGSCPNAENILKTAIRLNLDEFYSDRDVDDMIRAIKKVVSYYSC